MEGTAKKESQGRARISEQRSFSSFGATEGFNRGQLGPCLRERQVVCFHLNASNQRTLLDVGCD